MVAREESGVDRATAANDVGVGIRTPPPLSSQEKWLRSALHLYSFVGLCLSFLVPVCLCLHASACICMCLRVSACVCLGLPLYICLYIYLYICLCISFRLPL